MRTEGLTVIPRVVRKRTTRGRKITWGWKNSHPGYTQRFYVSTQYPARSGHRIVRGMSQPHHKPIIPALHRGSLWIATSIQKYLYTTSSKKDRSGWDCECNTHSISCNIMVFMNTFVIYMICAYKIEEIHKETQISMYKNSQVHYYMHNRRPWQLKAFNSWKQFIGLHHSSKSSVLYLSVCLSVRPSVHYTKLVCFTRWHLNMHFIIYNYYHYPARQRTGEAEYCFDGVRVCVSAQ